MVEGKMSNIAVITTFPSTAFHVYGKAMLESFVKYWPADIPLLVQLDDDLVALDVKKILRPIDGVAIGWADDHRAFVERNKHKDSPDNYRYMATRFCHKVFAIKRALDGAEAHKADYETGQKNLANDTPRYLIWMDADVITTRQVTHDDLKLCLPKEGDAVAYLGRKEWPHSECGWLAFDLQNQGNLLIKLVHKHYIEDKVLNEKEWHDSWIWDVFIKGKHTNLSPDAKGLDAWSASPMAAWSIHYKGPAAKQKMAGAQPMPKPVAGSNIKIQTMNAIPAEQIRQHIAENQTVIKQWIKPCEPTDEPIVFVSAGPQVFAEDVEHEAKAGHKIVAVKNAIKRLQEGGIPIWATILLDPRPHVYDFVKEPDKSIIYFVASQVDPSVVKHLLAHGCNVWGYHASVAANEGELTSKQAYAVVDGGTATATRGLYVLHHLGFKNFRLYGYELSYPDKPDMNKLDERGQAKYMEMNISINDPVLPIKRNFFTEPQFIAQFEEIKEILSKGELNLDAYGEGMIPFIVKAKRITDSRRKKRIEQQLGGAKKTAYSQLLA